MKTRFIIGSIVVAILIIGAFLLFWWNNQPEPEVNIEPIPMKCIYSETISNGTAVPNWTTESVIEAKRIDEDKMNPFEPLQSLTLDDQPLAWTTASNKVVVNNEIFSDLRFIKVTGFMGDAAPTVIGQITETDLEDAEWRTVLEFLLKSHIVKTYAHLESELCLEEEVNSDEEYKAHFSGVHRYCTNDCYEKPLDFSVIVDKKTKNITVQ